LYIGRHIVMGACEWLKSNSSSPFPESCGLGACRGGSSFGTITGPLGGRGMNTPATGVATKDAQDLVEKIMWGDVPLAYIIRGDLMPSRTTFLTPPQFKQQVGFVVYPAGGEIQRHVHRPLSRHLIGTSEVLIVRRGRCEIDIYNDDRELVATRELREGDVMLMVGGGHGFHMLEDTVFLEVKQGPYTGQDEKERF
jgi:hypothetical protein